jgi:hypothetical protein
VTLIDRRKLPPVPAAACQDATGRLSGWARMAIPGPCSKVRPCWEKRQRWVADVYLAEQDLFRVTLTAFLFSRAAVVPFLVAVAPKAAVLREVLERSPGSSRLPAQLTRPTDGELRWSVDWAVASLVSHEAMERTTAV